ncbi:MAG: hypothetical protein GX045_11445 [Clostridiaceae bacterium]|jgi:CRISPR-associated protein Csm3|nr:hypothetical protein [Clostridiaceae bacterium]
MKYPARNNLICNYDFVPLLNKDIQKFNDDTFAYEGKFELELIAEAPVYVGSGKETVVGGRLCRALIRNANGVPVIPGSSLKGVVRTIAQAVSNSGGCAEAPYIRKEEIKYPSNRNCKCLVCTMLGSLSAKSRVTFSDFTASDSDTPNLSDASNTPNKYDTSDTLVLNALKPYSHDVLDVKTKYFINNRPKGIKFYSQGDANKIQGEVPTECVAAGTGFVGEIIFQGLTETHLELLCFALGLDDSFPLRVGGNKPGFFGVVRPKIISFACYLSGTYRNLKLELPQSRQIIDMDPVNLAKAYVNKNPQIKSNIDKLRQILNRKV